MTFSRELLPAVDPRISLGSVLSIVSMVVALSLSWANLSAATAEVRAQLGEIRRDLDRTARDHDKLVQLDAEVGGLVVRKKEVTP